MSSYFTAKYYPTENKEKVSTVTTSTTLGVNLSGLTPETSYTVEVASVDIYGNVGAYSEPFAFVTTADTVAPIIAAFNPKPDYFNKSIPLVVTAQDDFSVASVTVQASQSNEKDAKWADAAVIAKQSYQNSNNDHKQYHSDNQQYKHKNGYALRSLGGHILFRRYYPTITI